MADIFELMRQIESTAAEPPLSVPEKALGYSRSYLAGPTFGFNDNIEALMASMFTNKTYDEELSGIREEQGRFKRLTPYTDNAVELASGAVLNPLDKLRKLSQGVGLANQASRVVTSSPAQGALASLGEANEDAGLKDAAIGATFGWAGEKGLQGAGNLLSQAGKEADRLKLSAFGINYNEIRNALRGSDFPDEVPFLQTIDKLEKSGVLVADNSAMDNLFNLDNLKRSLSKDLGDLLKNADSVAEVNPTFATPRTERFVKSISGEDQNKLIEQWALNVDAIEQQIGQGSLLDLQRAKVGLNYVFEQNPYRASVLKELRSDLRAEIERRVDDAVRQGKLSPSDAGRVKLLNSELGQVEEMQKHLTMKALPREYGGDIVEDGFRAGATTGGMGTATVTGNPLAIALGVAATAARSSEAKSRLADTLRTFQTPLETVGSALTGDLKSIGGARLSSSGLPLSSSRVVTGGYEAATRPDREAQTNDPRRSLENLMREIDATAGARRGSGREPANRESDSAGQSDAFLGFEYRNQAPSERSNAAASNTEPAPLAQRKNSQELQERPVEIPSSDYTDLFKPTSNNFDTLANDLFSRGNMARDLKDVEAEIDSDPYLSALYETESGRNPKAKNPKSSATGGFQFINSTAKALKLEDPTDLDASLGAVRALTDQHRARFGDDPYLLYAAHYLGAGLLAKVLGEGELSAREQELVRGLKTQAMPRFKKIFDRIKTKAVEA